MAVSLWVWGAVGWMWKGPLGALLGVLAGVAWRAMSHGADADERTVPPRPNSHGAENEGGQEEFSESSFAICLMVLAASMMRADGRVTRTELAALKQYLQVHYSADFAQNALQILRDLLKQEAVDPEPICRQMAAHMTYPQRMALLHMLYGIALADGTLHPAEERLLARMAAGLRIRPRDAQSIASMFAPSADEDADYRVLGISPSATDDEVRKAFRKMSMKHHPDRVAQLGADVQRAATEKFQQVNAAYQRIKEARGMT